MEKVYLGDWINDYKGVIVAIFENGYIWVEDGYDYILLYDEWFKIGEIEYICHCVSFDNKNGVCDWITNNQDKKIISIVENGGMCGTNYVIFYMSTIESEKSRFNRLGKLLRKIDEYDMSRFLKL